MKIDVGCGDFPTGDVNVDLYLHPEIHVDKQHRKITSRNTENFVRCDCQFLPFQNNVFDVSYCSHVIEHVANPGLLIKEMVRITKKGKSKNEVIIICPHRFSANAKGKYHKNVFSKTNFTKYLDKLGVVHRIKITWCSFSKFLPLIRPETIEVRIRV